MNLFFNTGFNLAVTGAEESRHDLDFKNAEKAAVDRLSAAYRALDDHRFVFTSSHFLGLRKFGTDANNMKARIGLIEEFHNAYADIANQNQDSGQVSRGSVLSRWKFFEACVATVRLEQKISPKK